MIETTTQRQRLIKEKKKHKDRETNKETNFQTTKNQTVLDWTVDIYQHVQKKRRGQFGKLPRK